MGAELHGVLAEFRTADELVAAANAARAHGWALVDAYAPFAVEGLPEAVGFEGRAVVPRAALLGGIAGGAGTYLLQWYSAVIDYPINAGGRPLHSWPAFLPAVFEITILGAALGAVIAMLAGNGLPRLRHPLFDVAMFDLATRNRFYLCLRAHPGFDGTAARAWLLSRGPVAVSEVPA